MLENIRENSQGIVARSILGFIILTFAVAGIGSYTSSVDTSVAEVNGVKISQAAFEQSYQSQRNRMQQQFGEMFETLSADPTYMANFRNSVVDNLINEQLLDLNADELAIRISDARIKDTIRNTPEFQVDGVYDNNRYLAMINQIGFYQSSDYRDYLRTEMTRRQLSLGLVGTEFSLPYQQSQLSALQNQTRDIRYATINAQQFKDGIELTDEEVSAFYQENQNRFQNQEKVKLEYVSLNVNDIAAKTEVSDQEVNDYYQQNIASFTKEEQRRVAHILVEFGEDESAAQAKAEQVVARINQGEDFGALAKEMSDDTVSAELEGDLDWIERGVMDEEFENAAYGLAEVGAVSEVVKSSFGFHIIKLTELVAEEIQTFDEVKETILADVKREKAMNKYFELQQELARVAFEFPDSLEDAAGVVDAEVKTSEWIGRGGNFAPFDNPQVIDAAFSSLVLSENLNSDLIELNDSAVMVIRLAEHQEASVKPLEEVAPQIRTHLTNNKATEKAQSTAQELEQAYLAGDDITAKLTELGASFVEQQGQARFGGSVDNAITKKAFVLAHPEAGTKSVATVELANGDLAIVEVTGVHAGTASEEPELAERQADQLAQATYSSYIEALKAVAEIEKREVAEPVGLY